MNFTVPAILEIRFPQLKQVSVIAVGVIYSFIYLMILIYEKLIYKADVGQYMLMGKKGDNRAVWVIIIIVVTVLACVLFFWILNDRIGGLLHL